MYAYVSYFLSEPGPILKDSWTSEILIKSRKRQKSKTDPLQWKA